VRFLTKVRTSFTCINHKDQFHRQLARYGKFLSHPNQFPTDSRLLRTLYRSRYRSREQASHG